MEISDAVPKIFKIILLLTVGIKYLLYLKIAVIRAAKFSSLTGDRDKKEGIKLFLRLFHVYMDFLLYHIVFLRF